MPTKTLFQKLELTTGTWTIEVVQPDVTTQVIKTPSREVEQTLLLPVDPWWELADTTIIKGV